MTSSCRYFAFEDRRAGVRRLRKMCGLTQQDLAIAANISQGTLSHFEGGDQDVSEAAFLRLEQALQAAMAAHRAELVTADQILKPEAEKPVRAAEMVNG